MIELLARLWWWVALRGVAAIGFGVLIVVWPGVSLAGLVLAFGVYVIMDGILAISAGIERYCSGERWLPAILEGALGLGIGTMVLRTPDRGAVWMCSLLALWAIATGIVELIAAIWTERPLTGGLLIALGITSITFGGLMLAWPAPTALALAWIIGGYAILSGCCLFGFAMQLHTFVHTRTELTT